MDTTKRRPRVSFNSQRLAEDIALKGWTMRDTAKASGVCDMTVARFLRGEFQTARTMTLLARALGRPAGRYLIRASA